MPGITREAILSATNYGVDIYAHILRVCYPYDEVIMRIAGRDCGMCRNPFASGHPTLHVYVHKTDPTDTMSPEIARHTTIDNSIPDGDAIFFAEHYYHIDGQQLYDYLNEELNLHLEFRPRSTGPTIEWVISFGQVVSADEWLSEKLNLLTHEEKTRRAQDACKDDASIVSPSHRDDASIVSPSHRDDASNAAQDPNGLGSESSGNSQGVVINPPMIFRFSFFKAPISNIYPYKHITLIDAYNYIKGRFAQHRTEHLRSLLDFKDEQPTLEPLDSQQSLQSLSSLKTLTDQHRQPNSAAKRYKNTYFDYCTFSGTFEKRCDNALIKHSGLLCIDFDHVQNFAELRSALLQDANFDTQLLFRSPSGDGIKWIIEIYPPLGNQANAHAEYFNAVANYIKTTYGIEIDLTGKDISRACYLPYDPDCYINPEYL